LEKNYGDEMDENETIKLAIKSLLEVVQTGAKNIEIAVMLSDSTVKVIYIIDLLRERNLMCLTFLRI
jgi:20S proteasome subunit alpha 4